MNIINTFIFSTIVLISLYDCKLDINLYVMRAKLKRMLKPCVLPTFCIYHLISNWIYRIDNPFTLLKYVHKWTQGRLDKDQKCKKFFKVYLFIKIFASKYKLCSLYVQMNGVPGFGIDWGIRL